MAEFFAGIGLVRAGLEAAGFRVVYANDLSSMKQTLYAANFAAADYVVRDISDVRGSDIPDIEVATASFPCTDLSLAGQRKGLAGAHSGLFWQFARVLEEMKSRRPQVVMLENVPGFATSRKGQDLRDAVKELNRLGYTCDLLTVDARHFVPQSRARLFVIGVLGQSPLPKNWVPSDVRPETITKFANTGHRELKLHARELPPLPQTPARLADVVERLALGDERWWDVGRVKAFRSSLSKAQADRLEQRRVAGRKTWATAYRRTRDGNPSWEIRRDDIAGCLRAVSGGSSKQALTEAGNGSVRVRWMTPREYARLQGAPAYQLERVSEAQALFSFGDAVCVQVITWLAEHHLSMDLAGR